MARTKVGIDPNALYVVVQSFSGDVNGVPLVFNSKTRLLGSHAAVQKYPDAFVRDGDLDELEARRRAAFAESDAAAAQSMASGVSEPTMAIAVQSVKLRALRPVRVAVDGEERQIKKGDLLEPSDPIGQFVPTAFERVVTSQ